MGLDLNAGFLSTSSQDVCLQPSNAQGDHGSPIKGACKGQFPPFPSVTKQLLSGSCLQLPSYTRLLGEYKDAPGIPVGMTVVKQEKWPMPWCCLDLRFYPGKVLSNWDENIPNALELQGSRRQSGTGQKLTLICLSHHLLTPPHRPCAEV